MSPLIAAYFATKPVLTGAHIAQEVIDDAVVHIMHCCEKHNTYLKDNPFEVNQVRLFFPERTSTSRMIVQHSVFSVQPDPTKCLIEYMEESDESSWIDRVVIPKNLVLDFNKHLTFLGYNERALFPDIEGVAQSLRVKPSTGHQYFCEDSNYLDQFK